MSSDLLISRDGPVATLTINRPDRRNPLGLPGDGDWFADVATTINGATDIRCVILTGAGAGVGAAFSAGGDLRAMRDRSGEFAGTPAELVERYRNGIHRVVRALWSLEVPLIAAVNGPAIGLGNDVACLADIRIAAEEATFGATFLKVGLVPGDGGAWLLPRVLGPARAAELLYTGRILTAGEALEWGLVSRVVKAAALQPAARELAGTIASQPPQALRMVKRLLRASFDSSFDAVMDMSAAMQAVAHTTADHREALDAFFEKRPPRFTGR
jgi:enoyl-CoA hydratase/carnithine racemase